MTSKKVANIQIADILSFYTPQRLKNYSPAALRQQLADLRTLLAFAELQLPKICADRRKAATQLQKIVNLIEKSAAELEFEFFSRPAANHELAYRVLSLSAPPLVASKPTPKLLKELKLKFLQSKNVSLGQWQSFLRKERNALGVSISQQKAEVLLGVTQKDFSSEMEWVILEAAIGGQKSPEFYTFFSLYWAWSLAHNAPHCSVNLIDDIKKLLANLPAIVLYLELKKAWKSYEEAQNIKYAKKNTKGTLVTYQWKFDFFSDLARPHFLLLINDHQALRITVAPAQVTGELAVPSPSDTSDIEAATATSETLTLCIKENKLPPFHYFLTLPEKVESYHRRIRQFYNKNLGLMDESCRLFVSLAGMAWVPRELLDSAFCKGQAEGVWIYLPIETDALMFVEEQGLLSSSTRERALSTLLAQRGVRLSDLSRHISLQEHLFAENQSFEFKLYELRVEESEGGFLEYEFRSPKFSLNQKYNKTSRVEESYLSHPLDANYNENYLLKLKLAFDFTKALFLGYKVIDGRKIDKLEEDLELYLKKDWKAYRDSLQPADKLSWLRVAQAASYLCRCFVPERFKHRRIVLKTAVLDLN